MKTIIAFFALCLLAGPLAAGRRHFCLDDREIFFLLEDEQGDYLLYRQPLGFE